MTNAAISHRLRAVASVVRDGAVLADVGCDHAYLPIRLLEEGKIEKAVLADVNSGPLKKAEENVREAGFLDKVTLIETDGAQGLENLGITDVSVCGMGGELIAQILDRSPWLKNSQLRFIFQPMSKQQILRRYLWDSGFEIDTEIYASDDGKGYLIILARYTGISSRHTLCEEYFGESRFACEELTAAKRLYLTAKLSSLLTAKVGKREGGQSAETEDTLLNYLKAEYDLEEA